MPKDEQSKNQPGGFPEHGDEYDESKSQQQDDVDGNDDNDDDGQDQNRRDDKRAREPQFATREELQEFQRKQDRIFSMLESLTKKPSGETQQQPNPNKKGEIGGMSAEEFEQLFWESPAEALTRYKQSIVQEMRGEQAKVTNQQQFWNDFYAEHKDLREDDDLVKLTLNANIATLADMPVKEASEKLADLTRKRILKYSGGEKRERSENGKTRVFTEGSEHRIPSEKKEQAEAPRTLGELIKARKTARRGGGKAMAS